LGNCLGQFLLISFRLFFKNIFKFENFFDVFEDTKFGDDHVSYTFRLSYRDKDKTLLDSDIKSIHSSIISKIEKSFNTKLRD